MEMDSDVKLDPSNRDLNDVNFDNLRQSEISPSLVAEILFKACSLNNGYYINELASLVSEKLPESSLDSILEKFDSLAFQKQFLLSQYFNYSQFLNFCQILTSSEDQFNATIGFSFFHLPWEFSQHFQFSLIKFCIENNHIVKILSSCNDGRLLNKKISNFDCLKCSPELLNDPQIETWFFQQIYQILIDLSSRNQILLPLVEEIFNLPLSKCPDFLVIGLLDCKVASPLKEDIIFKGVMKLLYPASIHHNSTQIFQKMWPNDVNQSSLLWSQKVLLNAMSKLYNTASPDDQQQKLSRILDLSQDLKALNHLLASSSHLFVIDLACLASRREYLKLDKWLNDKFATLGKPFVDVCMKFVQKRCPAFPSESDSSKCRTFLPTDTLNIIFHCFQNFLKKYIQSPDDMFRKLISMCSDYSHYISIPRPQVDSTSNFALESQLSGEIVYNSTNRNEFFYQMDIAFDKEVEENADSCFQKIYNTDSFDNADMEKFFEYMKTLKNSSSKKENNLFMCMLRNLLKEYRYLDQYPERELVITGEIFGGLIKHNLVRDFILLIILRYLVDSLQKSPQDKHFRFAISALDKLKHRLHEFPGFCSQIFKLPNFGELPPRLQPFIQYGRSCLEPQIDEFKSDLPFESAVRIPQKKQQPHCSTNPIENSSEVSMQLTFIRDKLQFMFNNLDYSKMEKFSSQIKEFLEKKELMIPIAHYFTKRAIAELNHHKLFVDFLSIINLSKLFHWIIHRTYDEIKVFFQNESDKKHLLSAGHWLGMITLERNKPVLTFHCDMHKLLVESYHKGNHRLMLAVPFVAKVLTGCANSRVFMPPNPWTVSLLNILADIYFEVDALNLKFELELLCDALKIKISDYKGKSNLLNRKEFVNRIVSLADSPTSSNALPGQSTLTSNMSIGQERGNSLPKQSIATIADGGQRVTGPWPVPSNSYSMPIRAQAPQDLEIKSNLQLIMLNPSLKNFIKFIIEKTLTEWTSQAAERITKESVTATEQIVKKDFALDPDSETLRNMALNFLNYLTSEFAYIYSKEQLREKIYNAVCNFLQSKCKNVSKDLIDITATTIADDNIDLCILFVQKACFERAVEELDIKLKSEYEIRRNRPDGFPYFDPVEFAFQNERMPVALRIMCGPTQPNKLNLYLQIPAHMAVPAASCSPKSIETSQSIAHGDSLSSLYDNILKGSIELIHEIDLPHFNSPVFLQVIESLKLAKQNPRDQTVAYNLISNVMNAFRELTDYQRDPSVESQSSIQARDFYLLILKSITDQRAFSIRFIANIITRCIMNHWFTKNQSFPDDLFDILLESELINLSTLDSEFARLVEISQSAIYYVVMIKFFNFYVQNGINPKLFANTLESFKKILVKYKTSHPFYNELTSLMETSQIANQNQEKLILQKKVEILFKEWLVCFHHNDMECQEYFGKVSQHGFFKAEESLYFFFKSSLEFCIEICHQIFNSYQSNLTNQYDVHHKCFLYLDSYAYLILYFIKYRDNIDQKLLILNRTLTLIAIVSHNDQAIRQQQFHYLPFYRILVVLFLEFSNNFSVYGFDKNQTSIPKTYYDQMNFVLVKCFCTTLSMMSPAKLPSFIYAWLEFISHRSFIGSCLNDGAQAPKLWRLYFTLISDLLQFEKPFIQNIELSTSFKFLYKGTLKLFLLLLHDFPDFLCEYCYLICDLIPHTTFQIRNLVLSAFPATMRLPDPFSPNLKVESLNEILNPYKGFINVNYFERLPFKKELDMFLTTRGLHYLPAIQQYFGLSSPSLQDQLAYINLIVFYLGQYATKVHDFIDFTTLEICPSIEVIQHLLVKLDTERRYFLLSSMVNHLRYPNLETQYFICVLLYLFKESEECIKEQIVRVLLERLFVYRPHPWGLLYIVNELSKNTHYNFWNFDFIKFEPKIKRILGNLGIYNN